MTGLFQDIGHEVCLCRSVGAATQVDVDMDADDEGDIDHPCRCRDVREV
jgi:hypothetical protein